MKKALLFSVSVLLSVQVLIAAGTQPTGSGNSEFPYQISTLDHLLWISTTPASWNSYFTQTSDIDASGTATWNSNSGWSPIGTGSNPFTGNYQGLNHTISGLTISRADHVQGFFGGTSNADILNLTLSDVSISITGDQQKCGAMVAQNVNTILSNCHASGTVKGDDYVGGLIGVNSGAGAWISECSFSGTVGRYSNSYTGNYFGGLIGSNESNAYILVSYTSASVSGKWYVGGLVGTNNASTIDGCYSTGTIGGDYYVGGLVGYNNNSSTINRSYSQADVGGYMDYTGGIAGSNNNSTISNCYSRGEVTRTHGTEGNFGSFIGKNENTSLIEYCYCTGAVIYNDAENPTDKGFIGNYYATGCNHNFFDTQTSIQSGGAGATAKTTSEMNDYSTFENAGWDFKGESGNGTDDIWNIGNARNDGYPYLDWQYPGDDVPLPITLSSFTAEELNGTVLLRWTSESETENAAFRIYRDNELLAQILGAGTSAAPHSYQYTDNYVIPGRTYNYTLADVDFQGYETRHNGLKAEVKVENVPAGDYNIGAAYPNPFNPTTSIPLNLGKNAVINAQLYDLNGRLMKELYRGYLAAGYHDLRIDGWELSTGIYFVYISMNGMTFMQKIALMK